MSDGEKGTGDNRSVSQAARLFHQRKYADAKKALLHGEGSHDNTNPKVRHNLHLCGLHLEGRTYQGGDKFLIELLNLRRQIQAKAENEDSGVLGVLDASLVSFNIAVMHIHLKHYTAAVQELEELHANIEPLDDFLAIIVSLLLTDLYLMQRHAKAATSLAYVEKVFSGLISRRSANGDGQPEKPNEETDKDTENETNNTPLDDKTAGLPLSMFVNSFLLRDSEEEQSVTVGDLDAALHLRKVRFAIHQQHLKSAKKHLRRAVPPADADGRTFPSLSSSMLKSGLEFLRGNHKKAMRLLVATKVDTSSHELSPAAVALIGGEPEEAQQVVGFIHYNNMGCNLVRMHKFSAALQLFTLALQECVGATTDEEGESKNKNVNGTRTTAPQLRQFALDRRYEILYNCGVCLLMSGDYKHAAQCFLESLQLLSNSPLLWLRLAECCALHHRHSQSSGHVTTHQVQDRTVNVLPREARARTGNAKVGKDQKYRLSLKFGLMCCRNALTLLNVIPPIDVGKQDPGKLSLAEPSALESDDLFAAKVMAHLNMAFMALCAGDPHIALRSAEFVIEATPPKGENSSGVSEAVLSVWKQHAHSYGAECCVLLRRFEDALSHLTSSLNLVDTSSGSNPPSSDKSGSVEGVLWPQCPDNSARNSKAHVLTNLALVYGVKGDLTNALRVGQQALSHGSTSQHTRLAMAYLFLRSGDTAQASAVLQREGGRDPK